MAHRPIKGKQVRKMRKALRQSPPAFMDLIDWLKDHRHVQTSGAARKLLVEGKVRHGSHVVGRMQVPVIFNGEPVLDDEGRPKMENVAYPYVPSAFRSELIVLGS